MGVLDKEHTTYVFSVPLPFSPPRQPSAAKKSFPSAGSMSGDAFLGPLGTSWGRLVGHLGSSWGSWAVLGGTWAVLKLS